MAEAGSALCQTPNASISGSAGPAVVSKSDINATCQKQAMAAIPLYAADFRACTYPSSFANNCPTSKCVVNWDPAFSAKCTATPVGAVNTVLGGGSGSFSVVAYAGCKALFTDSGKQAVMSSLMAQVNDQMAGIANDPKYACPNGSSPSVSTAVNNIKKGTVTKDPFDKNFGKVPVTAYISWSISCVGPANDNAYSVSFNLIGTKKCSLPPSAQPPTATQ